MQFQNIGVFSRHEKHDVLSVLKSVIDYLKSRSVNILLESNTAKDLETEGVSIFSSEELSKNCDLLISVGGDGNLLNVAKIALYDDIPVVGINCGKLGFLADITPYEIKDKLKEILNGKYKEEKRFLLEAHKNKDSKCIALNEIALITETPSRMIEFEIYVDEKFLCKQHSNGVIVATPTGSTAYALSAGGPILHPNIEALAIVPMLSHTLSDRAIVVKSESKIKIILTKFSKVSANVYGDNQCCVYLDRSEEIDIQKMNRPLNLIHPLNYDYFKTLRNKLNWGKKIEE